MAQITIDTTPTSRSWQASGLLQAWRRWRLYRQTVRSLADLRTHDLADIGLTRGSIERAAREAVYG
jgi:uncharacterized protein YjiS (DUF1127 family)